MIKRETLLGLMTPYVPIAIIKHTQEAVTHTVRDHINHTDTDHKQLSNWSTPSG